MTRRARTAVTAGVLALALVVMGAGFPAKGTPPKQWASGFCTALDAWRSVAVDGADQLKASLSGEQVSLADARTALVGYLGDVADSTEETAEAIQDLGAPDTRHGRKIQRKMVRIFIDIHGSVEDLQDRAERMSDTNERKALRQVRSIQKDVNRVFSGFPEEFRQLKKLDTGRKLDKAFDASAACQAVSS
jgi:hypothetical protein